MTALELMVAAMVLALGLVPLLSAQVETTKQAGFTHAHALAVAEAQALLDRAEALGWRRLAGGEGDAVRVASRAGPAGFEIVSAQVSFEEVQAGLGSLAADVTWRMGHGAPERRVRAVRMMARPDGSWLDLP